MSQIMTLVVSFAFEAAHQLTNLPATHKCARLHGHSFKFDVTLEGPVHPEYGWVMDYADVRAIVRPFVNELDHRFLNEIPGLEISTSEMIAVWLWERIQPQLPLLKGITVFETCNARCTYRGEGL